VRVVSQGTLPTTSAVVVTEIAAAPFVVTPASWVQGWSCQTATGSTTCAYAEPIAVGNEAPRLEFILTPSTGDGAVFDNIVRVATDGDKNLGNDTSTLPILVRRSVDAAIHLDFPASASSATVTITNIGNGATFSPVKVVCSGHPRSWATSYAFGDGWTSFLSGPPNTLYARHDSVMAPGESSSFTFGVGTSAGRDNFMACEVSTDGDVNDENDEMALEGGIRT
jgi:hypothetical protein